METAGIFHNCKTALSLKLILEALGYKQHANPIKTDNSTATSHANSVLKERISKAWDMRLHWIQDRVKQKQFHIYWDKGTNNYADYPTKHFPPSYHQKIRPKYVLQGY